MLVLIIIAILFRLLGGDVIFRVLPIFFAINAETDELENLELAQQAAREDAYKAAKKVVGKYEDK